MAFRNLTSRPGIHFITKCNMSSTSTRSYTLSSCLVTPAELSTAMRKNVYTRLSTAPRIVPLCAAWFMPNDPQNRTGYASFVEKRIPHAKFFDLDAVKDDSSPYPHMLPSSERFAAEMRKLGIHKDDSVVVYDTAELGIFSAPRVAWTFKVFGHDAVHILNNFKLYVDQGFPLEKGEPEVEEVGSVNYPVPELDKSRVATFEDLKERVGERGKEGAEDVLVLDARSTGRWEGKEAEPRAGLSSGHMPGSISIPFGDVLHGRTKAFLPAEELKIYFATRDVDPAKPIVSSCGTGVTACVLDAALNEAGFPEEGRRVYDGSWTEWAQRVKPEEGLIKEGKVA
ncbi:thiosulfate sulfurtransferas-like protein [Trichodelitschia bisporula]|uniref:Thiosulfate sulfurtransferas-like protein n=1 Tax=Trichodelitschia bisporula TaxID=703511 RepID=A0A6G1I3I1_9PEZI|nr:thiosulfate sulfurtransferas-like protein [Trichodelitschia bisporula]